MCVLYAHKYVVMRGNKNKGFKFVMSHGVYQGKFHCNVLTFNEMNKNYSRSSYCGKCGKTDIAQATPELAAVWTTTCDTVTLV